MTPNIWIEIHEGMIEAQQSRLDKRENWTPLMVYIHASRLILGSLLGFIVGFGVAMMVCLISRYLISR